MFNSTSAVVRLHDAFGLSNEKIREVLTAVARASLTLDAAFQLAPAGLERSTGLAAPLIAALTSAAPDSAYEKAAALQQRGFAAMTLLDPEYPLQLKGYRDYPTLPAGRQADHDRAAPEVDGRHSVL